MSRIGRKFSQKTVYKNKPVPAPAAHCKRERAANYSLSGTQAELLKRWYKKHMLLMALLLYGHGIRVGAQHRPEIYTRRDVLLGARYRDVLPAGRLQVWTGGCCGDYRMDRTRLFIGASSAAPFGGRPTLKGFYVDPKGLHILRVAEIRKPTDLAGLFRIASTRDALKMARLFTCITLRGPSIRLSLPGHLPGALEVATPRKMDGSFFLGDADGPAWVGSVLGRLGDGYLGVVEPNEALKFHLGECKCQSNSTGFTIERELIFPTSPQAFPDYVLKSVRERIGRDGAYHLISEKTVPTPKGIKWTGAP